MFPLTQTFTFWFFLDFLVKKKIPSDYQNSSTNYHFKWNEASLSDRGSRDKITILHRGSHNKFYFPVGAHISNHDCHVKPPLQTEAHISSLDIILQFQSKDHSHFKPQFQTENRMPSVESQFHTKVHMLSDNNSNNINDNPGGSKAVIPSWHLPSYVPQLPSSHLQFLMRVLIQTDVAHPDSTS